MLAGVGNHALALEHFERAHAADPAEPRVRMFLAIYRDAQGRQDEAASLLRSVPRAYLEQPDVQTVAGSIALSFANPDAAVERFARHLFGRRPTTTELAAARGAAAGRQGPRRALAVLLASPAFTRC